MGQFLGSHKTNILEAISIPSWRNIKRGDIIHARYRNLEGTSVEKIYLILHTYWPKADGKMHALDLSYINPLVLKNKLLKHTVQKQPISESFRGKTYTRLDFKKDEKNFYNSVIKPLVNDGFGPSYRTIFPENLSSIKLVDYEWSENKSADNQGTNVGK
jgi:hypothetical protein